MQRNEQNTPPTPEDVARRLVVLKHVVASALITPPRNMLQQIMSRWEASEREKFRLQAESQRDRFWQGLRDAGLWSHLSPREQVYAASTVATMTERQQIEASWRIEAVQTLMWALGLLEILPPYDIMASHDLLKQIASHDPMNFIRSARLRDEAELYQAQGVAEFWHWRSRTRELIERGAELPNGKTGLRSYEDIVRTSAPMAAQKGTIAPCIDEDFPAKGKAYRNLTPKEWSEVRSITVERHYTLNWLCGLAPGNRWDEAPTDT